MKQAPPVVQPVALFPSDLTSSNVHNAHRQPGRPQAPVPGQGHQTTMDHHGMKGHAVHHQTPLAKQVGDHHKATHVDTTKKDMPSIAGQKATQKEVDKFHPGAPTVLPHIEPTVSPASSSTASTTCTSQASNAVDHLDSEKRRTGALEPLEIKPIVPTGGPPASTLPETWEKRAVEPIERKPVAPLGALPADSLLEIEPIVPTGGPPASTLPETWEKRAVEPIERKPVAPLGALPADSLLEIEPVVPTGGPPASTLPETWEKRAVEPIERKPVAPLGALPADSLLDTWEKRAAPKELSSRSKPLEPLEARPMMGCAEAAEALPDARGVMKEKLEALETTTNFQDDSEAMSLSNAIFLLCDADHSGHLNLEKRLMAKETLVAELSSSPEGAADSQKILLTMLEEAKVDDADLLQSSEWDDLMAAYYEAVGKCQFFFIVRHWEWLLKQKKKLPATSQDAAAGNQPLAPVRRRSVGNLRPVTAPDGPPKRRNSKSGVLSASGSGVVSTSRPTTPRSPAPAQRGPKAAKSKKLPALEIEIFPADEELVAERPHSTHGERENQHDHKADQRPSSASDADPRNHRNVKNAEHQHGFNGLGKSHSSSDVHALTKQHSDNKQGITKRGSRSLSPSPLRGLGAAAACVARVRRLSFDKRDPDIHDNPATSVDEIWELLVGMASHLDVSDLARMVDTFRVSGLDTKFALSVPQHHGHVGFDRQNDYRKNAHETEENSKAKPVEIRHAHVVEIVRELSSGHVPSPSPSPSHVCHTTIREVVASVPADEDGHISEKACEGEQLDLRVFVKFMRCLVNLMQVEQQYIISHLVWISTRRFEMSDSMLGLVIRKAVGETKFDHDYCYASHHLTPGEFNRLTRMGGLIDPHHRRGVPIETAESYFVKTFKEMPKLRAEYIVNHPGLKTRKKNNNENKDMKRRPSRSEIPGEANHAICHSIVGRAEMSILFQGFWALEPLSTRFTSPLALVAAIVHTHSTLPEDLV